MSGKPLAATTKITIRFSETDPLGIVWHGNYVKYFEDGREEFGRKYGFDYLDAYKEGLITPIVKMDLSFKKPLAYNEKAHIETTFIDSEAAKIQFEYKIFNSTSKELVTTGSTMQVFLNRNRDLILTTPPSFLEWKWKWGLGNRNQLLTKGL